MNKPYGYEAFSTFGQYIVRCVNPGSTFFPFVFKYLTLGREGFRFAGRLDPENIVGDLFVQPGWGIPAQPIIVLRREKLLLHGNAFIGVDPQNHPVVGPLDSLRLRNQFQLCGIHAIDILRPLLAHVNGLAQILPACSKAEDDDVALQIGLVFA